MGSGVENHTRPALVGLRIHNFKLNTTSMYIQPHRGPLHGTMEHSTCFNTNLRTTMRPDNADGGKRGRIFHIPLATTRRTHSTKFCRVSAFMIVLCFRGVFEGARRWNYPFSSIQPFSRREAQLPPASASVLVLRVCCASCVFRSGASESASGSLPTRSTRSARAKRFTPIIPPPIFFFCHAFTRVLCHTPALLPNGTETCVFQRQLPSAYAFALVLHCPRVLGVFCVVVFRF